MCPNAGVFVTVLCNPIYRARPLLVWLFVSAPATYRECATLYGITSTYAAKSLRALPFAGEARLQKSGRHLPFHPSPKNQANVPMRTACHGSFRSHHRLRGACPRLSVANKKEKSCGKIESLSVVVVWRENVGGAYDH